MGRTFKGGVIWAVAFALILPGPVAGTEPDTVAPAIYLDQVPPLSTMTSHDVTFRAVPDPVGVTFECKLDAGPWTACTSPWQLRDLPEGTHDIAVRGTDAAGNTTPEPSTQTFRIDLTGPIAQVTINAGAATTARTMVELATSNSDGDPALSVRMSSRPEVDADGLLVHGWTGTPTNYDGHFRWDLARVDTGGSTATGVRTVYVQVIDTLGNVGAVTSDSIIYQPGITPVTVRIGATENPAETGSFVGIRATVTAADGAAFRDGVFRLSGCPGESPSVDGSGQHELAIECSSWNYPIGTLNIRADFVGSAELAGGTAMMSLKIGPSTDSRPPRIWLLAQESIEDGDPTETFHVTSSIQEDVTFQCRIDGGPWVSCGPTWTVPRPAPGLHILEARGYDDAGNWSTVNPGLAWRVAPVPSGSVDFDDYRVDNGIPTQDPVVGVRLQPASPAPLAVRLSSSTALDAQGRLAKAVEVAVTGPTTIELNVEDPATGGTSGDGTKWVIVQWQASDGTWEVPSGYSFQVDREAPTLRLIVNANEPFVDDDEVLVLPKPNDVREWSILLSSERERLEGTSPSGRIWYGPVWKIGEIPPGTVATRTIYARTQDTAGNWSPIATGTITIDRTAPVSTVLAPRFVVGTRVTTTSIPVQVRGASSDTGSGVARSIVHEAVGTGGFKQILAASAASVATIRGIAPSTGRTYRIGASDRLGHAGAYALGPTLRPYLRDETSAAIKYGPGWRRVAATAIGSDVMRSATAGARLDFTFTGRAVAVIAPKRSTLGRAQVYLDGRYVRTIDLRAGSTGTQLVVYSAYWSSPGSHRVTLKVLSSSGRPFDLDAFAVVP